MKRSRMTLVKLACGRERWLVGRDHELHRLWCRDCSDFHPNPHQEGQS